MTKDDSRNPTLPRPESSAAAPFRNRVAAVTGGSGGIGMAVCRMLRDEGARVASLDLKTDAGLENITSLECDIRSADSMSAAARRIHDTFGTPDVLVHSAAVNVFADTPSTTEAQFDSVTRINVLGAMLLTQAFVPEMLKRGGGAIVHVSSITGGTYVIDGGASIARRWRE